MSLFGTRRSHFFEALPSLFAGARCTRAPPFLGPYPSLLQYAQAKQGTQNQNGQRGQLFSDGGSFLSFYLLFFRDVVGTCEPYVIERIGILFWFGSIFPLFISLILLLFSLFSSSSPFRFSHCFCWLERTPLARIIPSDYLSATIR